MREGQQRRGEDHRDHAAGVDFERQVRGLAAHHAAAHHALGVLHRNAALAALHQHDERDHGDHHGQNDDQVDGRPVADYEHVIVDVLDGARKADHNAGEDQQRHAVADAALGDLLAQPHDERGAGGQA